MLHGITGHAEAYVRNLAAHAEHFSCWAIDFIGHGYSSKPDHPLEIQHYIDQVNHVLDALGVEKAYFTGESLGGWVTARFAQTHPERVERIVLNTMGGTMANPKVMERLYTLSMEAAKDPSWERVKARLEWLMADPAMVTDDLIRTRQAIFQQPTGSRRARPTWPCRTWRPASATCSPTTTCAAIQAPALVLWTTKDPSGPVDEAKRIASLIPNAQLAVMDNCGHWPQYEDTRHLQQDPPRLPARPQRREGCTGMTLALLAMSHSPLLEHAELDAEVSGELESAFAEARRFVHDFDPDVIVNFAPDHYNGFFYRLMPPFCIGYAAESIGDYGSQKGRLDVPEDLARALAETVISDGIDLAVSLDMQVDHGAVQPIEILYGDIRAKPFVPIFINSVAPPFTPVQRVRLLGESLGRHLATLDKKVLLISSGGLSHDPPVPRIATATPQQRTLLMGEGGPLSPEARDARQQRVIQAARDFAAGTATIQDLAPEWDRELLEILASGDLTPLDALDPGRDDPHRRQLRPRGPDLDRRIRRARRGRPLLGPVQLLPAHPRAHRRLRAHHRHARLTS